MGLSYVVQLRLMSNKRKQIRVRYPEGVFHGFCSLCGPLGVVMDKPLIQISLKSRHTFVEVFTEGNPEEFVQHSLIEAFDEAVGLRGFDFCTPVLNVVQGKVEFEWMVFGSAELPAIVGQNSADR
ncbi:hypothetical protein SDC9_50866 [bioreactor metagenome]|uniref:Uncharacterized protein n=1 Tax=bioreactor metagenome TaxID=1076179 RepID=A0A644WMB4_9ZZZZ